MLAGAGWACFVAWWIDGHVIPECITVRFSSCLDCSLDSCVIKTWQVISGVY